MSGVFGLEFQKAVTLRGLTLAELGRKIKKRKNHVSTQFLGMLARCERTAAPETIDMIADVLELAPHERRRLHHAAALDAGYDIGPM